MFRTILSSSAVYFLGSILNQASGFLIVLQLMRHFEVSTFGQYSYAAAFVAIFAAFADGGISQFYTRQFSLFKDQTEENYKRAQGIQLLISSVILTLPITLSIFFAKPSDVLPISLLSAGIALTGIFTPAFNLFIAWQKPWIIFRKDFGLALSKISLLGIGITLDAPIEYFCSINLLSCLPLFLYIFYIKNTEQIDYLLKAQINSSELVTTLRSTAPYAGLAIANVIYNKLDIFLLNRLTDKANVGYYAGATQFIYPFLFISGSILTAIFPLLSRNAQSKVEFRRAQRSATLVLGAAGFAVSSVLFLSCDFFFSVVLAGKYQASIDIYKILVWYLFLVFCYGSISNSIVALGKVSFLLFLNVAMIGVNGIANLLLIPRYGAIGAAYSTIGCEMIVLLIVNAYYKYLKQQN